MHVGNAIDRFDVFFIATSVTFWVSMINFSSIVKGLMNVTSVVNHKSQSEGLLIFLFAERLLDLRDIRSAVGT